jgi:hypothetical protein
MAKQIRLVGGAWRVIDGQDVKSYSTYSEALAGGADIEDQAPSMTTDDIMSQLFGGTHSIEGKKKH